MKFKDYIYAVLVLLLFCGLSGSAIVYAHIEHRMQEDNAAPVNFASPQKIVLNNEEIPSEDSTESPSQGSTESSSKSPTGDSAETLPDSSTATETGSDSTLESGENTTSGEEVTKETTEVPITSSESYVAPSGDAAENYYNDNGFTQVDSSYLKDAVFIGNSRLQGFILYSKLPDLCSYTSVGMNVNTYFTKQTFTVNGESMSASEALASTPGFQKVYLKFGINEIGWVSTDQFINGYKKILEHIYSINPDAIIYVQSVLPFSEAAMESDPSLDKYKVMDYNRALKDMAKEYHACYLDISSIYIGNDGYMPYEYSFDGVHLNVQSVQYWRDYILNHAIQ